MLRYLLEKEVKQFLRHPFLPKMVVMFPIVIILVLPWVVTMDVKNIRVCVADSDQSLLSQRLIETINGSNYFFLEHLTANFHDGLSHVRYG